MAKLNYSVEWSKYCEVEPCLNGTNEHTIALYPQKESVVLRTM